MNIAFPALFVFLLLIPGLLFLRARRIRVAYASYIALPPQPFSYEIASAFIASALIHAICCAVAFALPISPKPDLSTVLMLLLGQFGDNGQLEHAIGRATDHPVWLLIYFLFACMLGTVGGGVASRVFRKWRWLAVFAAPAYETLVDEWDGFFQRDDHENAIVSAIVDLGDRSYLFVGVLERIHFDPHTLGLDRIQLRDTMKRPYEKQVSDSRDNDSRGETDAAYEDVFGNQFMLRYSEIITLNVVHWDGDLSE